MNYEQAAIDIIEWFGNVNKIDQDIYVLDT